MLSHSSGQSLPLLLKRFLPWCLSPSPEHIILHIKGLFTCTSVNTASLPVGFSSDMQSAMCSCVHPIYILQQLAAHRGLNQKKNSQTLLFIKSKICCSQQSHFMSGFELAHDRWLWKCQAVFWDMSHQCSIVFYNPLHDLCLYLCRYKTAYLTFPFFPSLSETRRPVHSDSAGRHATWHRIWYEVSVGYGLRAQRFGRSEHPGQQQPGV